MAAALSRSATPGRGRPRSEAARIAVLEAAYEALADAASGPITIEAIAARAGASKVTIYRWWPDRVALLVDAVLHRLSDALPIDEADAPAVAIDRHARAWARALRGEIGRVTRRTIAECLTAPDRIAVYRDRYLRFRRDAAIRIIARGARQGVFRRDATAAQMYDALYGAIFYRFLLELGGLGDGEIRRLIALVMRPARGRSGLLS